MACPWTHPQVPAVETSLQVTVIGRYMVWLPIHLRRGGGKGGIKKKGINSRNKMEVKMVDMFSDSALIGSLARGTGGDGGYHCLLTQCNFSLGNNKRAL